MIVGGVEWVVDWNRRLRIACARGQGRDLNEEHIEAKIQCIGLRLVIAIAIRWRHTTTVSLFALHTVPASQK